MSDQPLQNVQDTIRMLFYQQENAARGFGADSYFEQTFTNLVPEYEVDSTTQTKTQVLNKRQGLGSAGSIDWMTGVVNSITDCTVLDVITITALYDVLVVAVFDDSNDTIYIVQVRPVTGTTVKIGSFTPTATKDDYVFLTEYSQSNAGSLYPAVAVSWTNAAQTASKAYYARSGSGVFAAAALTEITDTDYPAKQTPALITMGRFVWLNGVMYIASLDGRIWNSTENGNDITTWAATSVISIQAYPDQCIGLARYKHHVVAFGKNSIEFFNDVGNGANESPLAKTEQAFIKFGARSPRLIRNIDDVLYWIAYGDAGAQGLWTLDGYTPTKLSNGFFDTRIIGSLTTWGGIDPSSINMQAITINSKKHLVLNGIYNYSMVYAYTGSWPTADTYDIDGTHDGSTTVAMYNIEDKTFWNFSTQTNRAIQIMCATAYVSPTASGAYDQYVILNAVNLTKGQQYVYKFRTDGLYKDDVSASGATLYPSAPILALAQTNLHWFGNEKRKRISKAKVIMFTPILAALDTNVYSMYLLYTKDNVQDGTNITQRSMTIPNAQYRHYWSNLGMGRVWSFCLLEKSKMNLRLQALELDIQQGSH